MEFHKLATLATLATQDGLEPYFPSQFTVDLTRTNILKEIFDLMACVLEMTLGLLLVAVGARDGPTRRDQYDISVSAHLK